MVFGWGVNNLPPQNSIPSLEPLSACRLPSIFLAVPMSNLQIFSGGTSCPYVGERPGLATDLPASLMTGSHTYPVERVFPSTETGCSYEGGTGTTPCPQIPTPATTAPGVFYTGLSIAIAGAFHTGTPAVGPAKCTCISARPSNSQLSGNQSGFWQQPSIEVTALSMANAKTRISLLVGMVVVFLLTTF